MDINKSNRAELLLKLYGNEAGRLNEEMEFRFLLHKWKINEMIGCMIDVLNMFLDWSVEEDYWTEENQLLADALYLKSGNYDESTLRAYCEELQNKHAEAKAD